jgi:hypothetical protein
VRMRAHTPPDGSPPYPVFDIEEPA